MIPLVNHLMHIAAPGPKQDKTYMHHTTPFTFGNKANILQYEEDSGFSALFISLDLPITLTWEYLQDIQ